MRGNIFFDKPLKHLNISYLVRAVIVMKVSFFFSWGVSLAVPNRSVNPDCSNDKANSTFFVSGSPVKLVPFNLSSVFSVLILILLVL